MRRPLLYWATLVVYMGVVLAASLFPMPQGLPQFWQVDKLYHFGAYFVMGALWAWALYGRKPGAPSGAVVIRAAIVTFCFGAFVEFCQYFIPYRSADVLDALVNGTAGVVGALVYARLKTTAIFR